MAFTTDAQKNRSTTSMQKLNALVTVQSVDINSQSMVVVASGADNNDMIEGTFTVGLDLNAIPSKARTQSAEAAGGGFCGAVIDKMTERHVGRKMIIEGLRLTGESTGVCRWLSTYRHERQRRPGIVHTYKTTDGHAQISGVTVFDHEAFKLNDDDRMNAFYDRADKHFRDGTTPKGATNERDQVILRTSMPISVLSMVIVDKADGAVLENTVRLGLKEAKAQDFPEHYSEEERQGFNNRPPKLPRNSTDYKELVAGFTEYAAKTYPGRDLALLGVEGIQYKATRKGGNNRNMRTQSPVDLDRSPIAEIHRANMTSYRIDPNDDENIMRGAYVPTVNIQFSPNRGDTYNKFIDVNAQWPEKDVNWLSKVTFDGKPLYLPESLSKPCRNAQLAQKSMQNSQETLNPAPDQNAAVPGTNVNGVNTSASLQDQHVSDPGLSWQDLNQAATQHSAPERKLPKDPAFDESQSLDNLGQPGAPTVASEPKEPAKTDAEHSSFTKEQQAIKPDVQETSQPSVDKPVREDVDIIPSECPFIGAGPMNMGM